MTRRREKLYFITMYLGIPMLILVFAISAKAQIKQPVKWQTDATPTTNNETIISITALIDQPWHIYSQFMDEGGPLPTRFTFVPSDDYTLIGKVEELNKPEEKFDNTFFMPVRWFEKSALFQQRIKLNVPVTTIALDVEFMACTEEECLLPETKRLTVEMEATEAPKEKPPKQPRQANKIKEVPPPSGKETDSLSPVETPNYKSLPENLVNRKDTGQTSQVSSPLGKEPVPNSFRDGMATWRPDEAKSPSSATGPLTKEDTLPSLSIAKASPLSNGEVQGGIGWDEAWTIFITGLLGGFAAFLMPCIFPMLPLTVGYFARHGRTKGNAVGMAFMYGLSIIAIYVSLGLLVTVIFGSDALNVLSTNGIFNFLFFLLLVVFAASFIGAFEITLPASWSTFTDKLADRGGRTGIFFMATTLALVSFSCTGPIVGTLLVEAARMGNLLGPAVGMTGFSLALALPFTIFSMFPSWLQKLPQSGSWMHTVKVTLGFLELALALKFLSNVDLAYHWELLDREVFLVLWVIIFGLLGLYLLGKLRLDENAGKKISTVRLFASIVVLSFALYLVPGLWGAPLRVVSAFLPPQHTQDFDLYTASLVGNSLSFGDARLRGARLREGQMRSPLGLQNVYFDYDEGMAQARIADKPVMLDFTGHACVNCRKMETTVWSASEVLPLIRDRYIVIQLYVDDKTKLPEAEQTVSEYSSKKLTTIGSKWSDFQAGAFGTNSQPYYVLLDHNGRLLTEPQGADYDAASFRDFLMHGLD